MDSSRTLWVKSLGSQGPHAYSLPTSNRSRGFADDDDDVSEGPESNPHTLLAMVCRSSEMEMEGFPQELQLIEFQ